MCLTLTSSCGSSAAHTQKADQPRQRAGQGQRSHASRMAFVSLVAVDGGWVRVAEGAGRYPSRPSAVRGRPITLGSLDHGRCSGPKSPKLGSS
jgi:hypothetical protein